MNKINATIIYAGMPERADVLSNRLPSKWSIFTPEETLEALAMYTFYYPDVVVIEDSAENDFAYDVYTHLQSIGAENLLMLTDRPQMWDDVRTLPLHVDNITLLDALQHWGDVLPLEETASAYAFDTRI